MSRKSNADRLERLHSIMWVHKRMYGTVNMGVGLYIPYVPNPLENTLGVRIFGQYQQANHNLPPEHGENGL